MSGTPKNEEFELPDGSYYVSDIQECFEYIIKNMEKFDKFLIQIYINNIENWITFKPKPGHHLKLLTLKIMKLLRSIKIKITKEKNVENKAQLEITKVIIVHCHLDNNTY